MNEYVALGGPILVGGKGPPHPLCFQDSNHAVPSQLHHLVTGVENGLFFLPQGWASAFSSLTAGSNHL